MFPRPERCNCREGNVSLIVELVRETLRKTSQLTVYRAVADPSLPAYEYQAQSQYRACCEIKALKGNDECLNLPISFVENKVFHFFQADLQASSWIGANCWFDELTRPFSTMSFKRPVVADRTWQPSRRRSVTANISWPPTAEPIRFKANDPMKLLFRLNCWHTGNYCCLIGELSCFALCLQGQFTRRRDDQAQRWRGMMPFRQLIRMKFQ